MSEEVGHETSIIHSHVYGPSGARRGRLPLLGWRLHVRKHSLEKRRFKIDVVVEARHWAQVRDVLAADGETVTCRLGVMVWNHIWEVFEQVLEACELLVLRHWPLGCSGLGVGCGETGLGWIGPWGSVPSG